VRLHQNLRNLGANPTVYHGLHLLGRSVNLSTGGGGALKLFVWADGSHWTLIGK